MARSENCELKLLSTAFVEIGRGGGGGIMSATIPPFSYSSIFLGVVPASPMSTRRFVKYWTFFGVLQEEGDDGCVVGINLL